MPRWFLAFACLFVSGIGFTQDYPNIIHYKPNPLLNDELINGFFIDQGQHIVVSCRGQNFSFEKDQCLPYRMSPWFVPDSLDQRIIRMVPVDSARTWYFTRNDGLIYVDQLTAPGAYRFFPVDPLDSCGIGVAATQKAVVFPDGHLFFVQYNNGFYGYDPVTDCFRHYHVSEYLQSQHGIQAFSNRVRVLLRDPDSPTLLWMGSDDGLLSLDFAADTMTYYPYTGPRRLAEKTPPIYIDVLPDGKIILFSWEEGVRTYNRHTGAWKNYPHPESAPGEEDRCNGELIILSDTTVLANYRYRGLYEIHLRTGVFRKYVGFTNESVPSSNRLRGEATHLFMAADSTIWIRQSNGYLSAIFPWGQHTRTFQWYEHINTVFKDTTTGDLLVGGNNGAIERIDLMSHHRVRYKVVPVGQSGEEDDIHGFQFGKDQQLYALGNRDIYRIDERNLIAKPVSVSSWQGFTDNHGESYDIFLDQKEFWWILMKFDGILKIRDFKEDAQPIVVADHDKGVPTPWTYWTDITETSSGVIWMSSERGLAATRDGGESFDLLTDRVKDQHGNAFGVIREIALDQQDRLWVSTDAGNVGYISNANQAPYTITTVGRYPNLRDIVTDEHDDLWVLTMDYLYQIDGKDFSVQHYASEYGIPLKGCHSISLLDDGSGHKQLLLYSGSQVIRVDKASLRRVNSDAFIELTAYKKHNEQWISLKGRNVPLVFAPKENYLSFRISTVNTWGISNINIQHRIPQLHQEWIDGGNIHQIDYTNLPGGRMTLEIRMTDAATGKGIGPVVQLPFRILKAFVNTLGFKILVGALLAGIIFLIWNARIRRIRREEALKREAFEREEQIKSEYRRQLIDLEMAALRAQMNPHFLFNSLNSIKRMVMDRDDAGATKYLEEFADLVRLVLNNTREKFVPLEDELQVIRLYVELEKLRFKDRFDVTIHLAEEIDPDFVLLPPMLLQPFVENAIWHGLMHKEDGKGELIIHVRPDGEHIVCTITDNGIGRQKAKDIGTRSAAKYKSLSTRITSQRLEMLRELYGAESRIEIHDLYTDGKASGTEVRITLPWTSAAG